jgi:F420-dependent oxidoreductase-like protein
MAKVELGVHTGQQNIELDELRRLWRHCEASGFDWISVWDHFYEAPPRDGNSPTYEAVALMAAIALETQRVRIGCLVFCMGYRNPALLAKSLTTIDHLSHGRVTVGLGAGWHVQEHNEFGYSLPPLKERMDRLSEGVRVIRAMLRRPHGSSFQGRYYKTSGVRNLPPPVQERVPIIVGGRGERRTLRIAARRADGWNVPYISAADFKHKSQVLDRWCDHYQRDPATIERSVNLHFLMSSRGPRAGAAERLGPMALEGGLHGEPQQVIDRLGEYVDAGAQRVNIAFRPPIDWDALQSYVEDVMPAFR